LYNPVKDQEQTVIEIEIYKGDITQLELDALVNAANNRLWMGGGVAGAIKHAGGGEIEAEAVSKGPIPVGQAVVTGAGRLKAGYIIHAAVMGQDLNTDAEKIRQATRNSLFKADEMGIKSLAFPALGTGVGGFQIKECARIMIAEVLKYSAKKTGLKKVVFALFDEQSYMIFKQELDKQLTKPA
jgi:O-acetyl-ADP-ribose deacetylase (regulator of RNase III)